MSVTGNDMSEELKGKLYNYEENPSEKMWNRIAASLDEEINAEFAQKLYEAEVTPPAAVWNNIEASLDKEEYPAKLYNVEVTPPAGTWQKISDALDEEEALPRIPQRRRVVPFVRYAVAASLIGVIAFGTLKLINQKSTGGSVATRTIAPRSVVPTTIQPNVQKDSSAQAATILTNNLPKPGTALAKANVVTRRKTTQQASYMTLLAGESSGTNSSSAVAFQHASLSGEVPGNCAVISDADRYLSFMNPDGYLIRMSKKLAEALGCYYNNGNSEEYNQCQEQIKKWRDKIAQSPASSSPDNFMDILDIIKTIQDKEL